MDDSHPGLYDRGLLSFGSDWTDRPDSRECLICLIAFLLRFLRRSLKDIY